MLPRSLVLAVAALGVLLTATAVRGPFTIDENNYLVTVLGLRQGRLTLPGTDGLPPSRELLYFDPAAVVREVTSTPVASTAPPLYAPLALAFSFLGWRGLVGLNTLAFLAVIVVVFLHSRRFWASAEAPWFAAAAVGGGGYLLEYGQGMWPHMVAVALVAAAVLFASNALEDRPERWAAGGGFLVAAAAGVRYQNAFILGCLGLGLLLLARHRLRAALAFALGAAPPLLACSLINHARLGSWNPISKGPGYLSSAVVSGRREGFFADFVTMAWARIVDYSTIPPLTGTVHESFHTPHPESGAYVMVTAVKKAWLQSSPWMIVPLLILVLAWLPRPAFERIAGGAPQRQLRFLSVIVILTLGMFSASGVYRTDGLCFNQRYFCELVPLVGIAFAWSVEGIARRRTALLAGILAGAALALLSLAPHHLEPLRHYLVMYVPLGLAALLALAWCAALAMRARGEAPTGVRRAAAAAALAFLAGAGLAWGLAIHLGDDVKASRIMRRSRQDYLRELRPYLSDHSAIFAGGGIKDALGPLQMELDIVIAVPGFDRAATTRELLAAFLEQDRRVFFLPNVMPPELLDDIFAGKQLRYFGDPVVLIEVRDGPIPVPRGVS